MLCHCVVCLEKDKLDWFNSRLVEREGGVIFVRAKQHLPYSQKYWWSLNLVVWPQTKRKKILAEFKFGSSAPHRITSS